MKTTYAFFAIFLFSTNLILAQFVEHTEVYGQVQTDINRGYQIRQMPDGNFIIAGQWNDQAYLLRVDCEGSVLASRLYGDLIGGVSSFTDVQRLNDSSWVAVGACDHCLAGDTTSKALLLKVDNDLVPDAAAGVIKLGKSARYPQFPASTQDNPQLLVDGNTLVLLTQYGLIGSLNASDLLLTKLNFDLDTLSTRLVHHQYFDSPAAVFKNPTGYLIVANHAFFSGAATIQIDENGNKLWTNTGLNNVTATAATLLPNGNVLICGVQTDNGNWIGEFSGTNGAATVNQLTLGGERATDLTLLSNGNVLLTGWFPLFTGTRSTRIYRLQTNPLQIAGNYDLVPNPDIFTNMGSHSIVALDGEGASFATAGVRGFYNRTFFHTKRDCSALTSPGSYSGTLCPGESVLIGNTVFNEANPSGDAILAGLAACGCDSTVQVNISFYPEAESDFSPLLCPGESVTVGGQTFDRNKPKGDVLLPGQSANGCDSTVHVSIRFYPEAESDFSPLLCPGESVTVGGQTFDRNKPKGDVLLPGQSVNGCDSTIHVSIGFYPVAESDFSPVLCPGESVTVNGQTFDRNNPKGDVLLPGQSVNGCDSTVHVSIRFYPAAESDFAPALCPGGSVTVGGQTFDAANPTGDVLLSGQSANGCDSTVHVSVSFYPAAQAFISDTLFTGDSLVVGDIVFNVGNPAGTVVLPNASHTGCDSIVVVDLKFVTGIRGATFVAGTFKLLQNPVKAKGIIYLEYDLVSSAGIGVNCLDITGKCLWERKIELPAGKGRLHLQAPDVAGAYWLIIRDANGYAMNGKFAVFE